MLRLGRGFKASERIGEFNNTSRAAGVVVGSVEDSIGAAFRQSSMWS